MRATPFLTMVAVATFLAASPLRASAASPTIAAPTDTLRTVSVNDPTPFIEPPSGTAPLVFTVTLNGPALVDGQQVSLHLLTADYAGTGAPARANADYIPVDTNLTFVANGSRTREVSVLVDADPHDGPGHDREMFTVQLSNPVGAQISRAVGVGTIIDYQQQPGAERCAIHDDPFFFDMCLSKLRWDASKS